MNRQRVATQFGPKSTAAEVIAGIDPTGCRIVTGAASGIASRPPAGRAMPSDPCRRNRGRQRVAEQITASTGKSGVCRAAQISLTGIDRGVGRP
jgi:hypothetical protein